MKIKREELKKALEIVKPGLANKDIIPQATAFAFMGNKIVTYNDEIYISHPIEGLDITGAIQSQELYQFLNKINSEEIDIDLQGCELILQSKRSKAGFTLQSKINLPLDEIEEVKKWEELPENFIEALKFVVGACSNTMSKPILTCVHCNETGFIEGSDSFRIASFQLDEELPVETFLVPAKNILEIIKLNPDKIYDSNQWVYFQTGNNTIIAARKVEGEYPNTEEIVQAKMDKTIKFPDSILDLIDKASVFSKREYILDETIEINISGKRFKIRGECENGWFEETCKLDQSVNQSELIFTIPPYLLKDILKKTKECKISENALKFVGKNWIYLTSLL